MYSDVMLNELGNLIHGRTKDRLKKYEYVKRTILEVFTPFTPVRANCRRGRNVLF